MQIQILIKRVAIGANFICTLLGAAVFRITVRAALAHCARVFLPRRVLISRVQKERSPLVLSERERRKISDSGSN
jgi:hypothetical protein